MVKPWMTGRHCRMRLKGIEEVLSELIEQVRELEAQWAEHWLDAEDVK